MAYVVTKVKVYSREVDDVAGTLGAAVAPLAGAGVDLTYLVGYAAAPGKSRIFLVPSGSGTKVQRELKAAGFSEVQDMSCLLVEGTNKVGVSADIGQRLGKAGVNMAVFDAFAIGRRFRALVALRSAADATKAARRLKAK